MARRKSGDRYPCGKLKPKEWLPFRQEFLSINRVRDAKGYHTHLRDLGTSALDRLVFRNLISQLERQAGEELLAIWLRYRATYASLPYPWPKVAALQPGLRGSNGGGLELPSAASVYAACRKAVGKDAINHLLSLCVFDYDPAEPQLFMIRRGLRALVKHFGFSS